MRKSFESPRGGLVLIAVTALLLQGCAVAAGGSVAAVGGLGYGLSKDHPEVTASAPQDNEQDATDAPVGLVEPPATVEPVEVQQVE